MFSVNKAISAVVVKHSGKNILRLEVVQTLQFWSDNLRFKRESSFSDCFSQEPVAAVLQMCPKLWLQMFLHTVLNKTRAVPPLDEAAFIGLVCLSGWRLNKCCETLRIFAVFKRQLFILH
jgi:hypothetical protein